MGILHAGEVPERLNGPVLKTGARKCRGFESHPLRQPTGAGLASLAVALLVIGCQLLPARTFVHTFPAAEGGQPLPLTLTDRTGLVTGLDAAPDGFQLLADDGFGAVPGRPRALVAHWVGGACDDRVAITAEGPGLTLTVETTVRPVACEGVGILRAVVIELAAPLDRSRTSIEIKR